MAPLPDVYAELNKRINSKASDADNDLKRKASPDSAHVSLKKEKTIPSSTNSPPQPYYGWGDTLRPMRERELQRREAAKMALDRLTANVTSDMLPRGMVGAPPTAAPGAMDAEQDSSTAQHNSSGHTEHYESGFDQWAMGWFRRRQQRIQKKAADYVARKKSEGVVSDQSKAAMAWAQAAQKEEDDAMYPRRNQRRDDSLGHGQSRRGENPSRGHTIEDDPVIRAVRNLIADARMARQHNNATAEAARDEAARRQAERECLMQYQTEVQKWGGWQPRLMAQMTGKFHHKKNEDVPSLPPQGEAIAGGSASTEDSPRGRAQTREEDEVRKQERRERMSTVERKEDLESPGRDSSPEEWRTAEPIVARRSSMADEVEDEVRAEAARTRQMVLNTPGPLDRIEAYRRHVEECDRANFEWGDHAAVMMDGAYETVWARRIRERRPSRGMYGWKDGRPLP